MSYKQTDYSKLRVDVLEELVQSRGLICKTKKEDMIKVLQLDDEGKYQSPMEETTYEKFEGGFIVGIDYRNKNHLNQIGKIIEKKDGRSLSRFMNGVVFYWSKSKLI